jgi:hypothetical protein
MLKPTQTPFIAGPLAVTVTDNKLLHNDKFTY